MRFGIAGGSYTAQSTAVADEEAINLYQETLESQGAIVPKRAYGGQNADNLKAMYVTPGIGEFSICRYGPMRGSVEINGRIFVVSGPQFIEVFADGTQTVWDAVANDGLFVSLAKTSIQILIVSAGKAYCFTLATNILVEVTSQLAGTPVKVRASDTYFVVMFQNSNKYQLSQLLDGTTWPGLLVGEPEMAGNLRSIEFNHTEFWVFTDKQCQPYQNTGSPEVFDRVEESLIESGAASTHCTALLDNSIFWVVQDQRGGRWAARSNGYTPSRISNHAVEDDLDSYSADQIAGLISYSLQYKGHFWWVLYIPNSSWSWVYDVTEGQWFKLAKWVNGKYQAWWGWNHVYAFGKHLIGDWNSGNIYELNAKYLTDNGTTKRWLRRCPTISDESKLIFFDELRLQFSMGQGPQPPLIDGNGNPRPPQVIARWSDDSGSTWSNEHMRGVGFAGKYGLFARWLRLGSGRRRVFEFSGTDPIEWIIVDGFLYTHPSTERQ